MVLYILLPHYGLGNSSKKKGGPYSTIKVRGWEETFRTSKPKSDQM
ncbi:Exportin-T [Venturia inaequalis]|nr:Exportin-T [Venturia inaequalis]